MNLQVHPEPGKDLPWHKMPPGSKSNLTLVDLGVEFRFLGLGLRFGSLGFRVYDCGLGFGVSGLGLRDRARLSASFHTAGYGMDLQIDPANCRPRH